MEKICEKVLYQGRWLSIKELHYLNNDKKKILWESITRKNTFKILVVLAKLKPSNRYILIKQFRPSINNTVIGFPAGLAETEDIQKEALKELKEETGFWGKITAISPDLAFNPALSDEIVQVISVEVDEYDPINANPVQSLEPDEEIDVVLVEEKSVKDFLIAEQKKGVAIGIALWYLFGVNS
ncbi:MAG: NUDIX hydrolase [Candidatus Omnitrophota bacterium]